MRSFLLFLMLPAACLQGANSRDPLVQIRYQLQNCESDILSLQERFNSNETTQLGLKAEIESSFQKNRDLVKATLSLVDEKIAKFEKSNKELLHDLNAIKDLANAAVKEIESYEKKVATLEKIVDKQAKNLAHMETAMNGLLAHLMQEGQPVHGTTYTVQTGDCLGSISKKVGASVKALKEANQITNDKIVVGQTLIIP